MKPVAIQLVFCSWFNSLPMAAYEDKTMVVSIATRKIPMARGGTCAKDLSTNDLASRE
jgi:hypothetical protein